MKTRKELLDFFFEFFEFFEFREFRTVSNAWDKNFRNDCNTAPGVTVCLLNKRSSTHQNFRHPSPLPHTSMVQVKNKICLM
jgi:hypothetical protein